MRYMMLICGDETMFDGQEDGPEFARMVRDTEAWVEEMDGRGIRVMGERLSPTATATTVRTRDDNTLVTDGPFAETKEQILGFDLIECENLDQAIEVASKHPITRYGSIEVRPFWTS